jgi:hypothetical protein
MGVGVMEDYKLRDLRASHTRFLQPAVHSTDFVFLLLFSPHSDI